MSGGANPLSGRLAAGAGVLAAIALLAVLALTGRAPEKENFQRFEPGGILAIDPAAVTGIALQLGERRLTLVRQDSGGWALEGGQPLDAREAEHVRLGLRFLAVSKPSRVLGAEEVAAADLAGFGLAEPATRVTLLAGKDRLAEVAFGDRSETTSDRYALVAGRPEIYLLAPHVAEEWEALEHLDAAPGAGGSG